VTGWERVWVQVEKQAVGGNDQYGGHWYVCEGDVAVFQGDEGEPLDGRDQLYVLAYEDGTARVF
jgi:hypothetical protein